MKLSARLKEISDAMQSTERVRNITSEDWYDTAKDCTHHSVNNKCDEFRNKTGICFNLYCPIIINYKGK